MAAGGVRLNKFPVSEVETVSARTEKAVKCSYRKNSPCYSPPASIAVSGPICSTQCGRWSKKRAQCCQAEIRFALLSISLGSLLSPTETTLNDICYHQDNLCQLHDETANDGPQIVRGRR